MGIISDIIFTNISADILNNNTLYSYSAKYYYEMDDFSRSPNLNYDEIILDIRARIKEIF